MAWNQSKPNGDTAKKKKSAAGSRGVWLAVAAVAVVVAAGLYFAFSSSSAGDEGKPALVQKKTKPTEEVSRPAPAPAAQPKAEEVAVDPNARPTKVGEVVNGYVMLPSGRIHKPTGVVTNRVADYGRSKYSIFESRSDNEIAGILMMKPGEAVVGLKRYDRWFTKQFLKSIETPIDVSPDDEPWQADLKRNVIQARAELKEAYDRGEDIAAIMSESRQQLQDLSKYKQAIKQLYAQNRKECETDAEVGELQRAVNIMLEEKGCAPIDFTPLTKLNLKKDKTYE